MTELSAAQSSVYEAIRRLMLDLCSEEGVEHVVMLDDGGEAVLQLGRDGTPPSGRFLASLHRAARAMADLQGWDKPQEPGPFHLQNGSRCSWIAETGFGTRLVVFWDTGIAPGMLWRSGWPLARELRRLLGLILPGPPVEAPRPDQNHE